MITYLKLTNFKKVENDEMFFTSGLNLIRAPNEASKSTRLQAIAYALYGARALPMPLAETVTYGKPESTLRVLLRFSFNGSEFEIERHKGGAELRGDGVTASGQAEVTAFVDRLFNCNAAVANSLMFANQGALRGALEGGSGAAVSLIEKLADVDALDRLVAKAQENLPSGNTKLLEARIAELQGAEKPAADFTALEDAVLEACLEVASTDDARKGLEAKLSALDVRAAQATIAEAEQARKALASAVTTQARLLPDSLYEAPTLPDVGALRNEAARESLDVALRKQYRQFTSYAQTWTSLWDSEALKQAYKEALESEHTTLTKEIQTLQMNQARAEMAIVKEDLCGFCGKSFADVPEVIAKNAWCAEIAANTKAALADVAEQLVSVSVHLKEVTLAEATALTSERAMAGLPVEAYDGYPAKYRWVGEVPAESGPVPDYRALIQQAEAKVWQIQTKSAQANAAREQLQSLDIEGLSARVETLSGQALLAQVLLREHAALQAQVTEVQQILREATSKMHLAQQNLTSARSAFAAAQKAYEAVQASLAQAKSDLSTYLLNNRIIKKIRDARPLVARQLWGVVLGTVSHYFSQVRGTPSVVTREGAGFCVDGKPVEALSGSTLDALGLAIRIALTRTFLSNVPWLILDEPGAAADSDREAAMLGVVSSCGFPQVIMVSHSDVGDSYAANVITF